MNGSKDSQEFTICSHREYDMAKIWRIQISRNVLLWGNQGAICKVKTILFTTRKRSLEQGNVFTPVCHSVQGGVSVSRGVCIRGVGQIPPSDTTGYGPRVGGTHPTWMHSCLANFQNAARRRHVHTSRKPMGKRKRSRNNRKRSKKKFRTSKKIFAFAFWFRSVLTNP